MYPEPSTGITAIDNLLTAILPGDNVVWQVDDLDDYRHLSTAFAKKSLQSGRRLIYFRFAPHEPVLQDIPGVEVVELDPSVGFDPFAQEVHLKISQLGREVFYVFDNLSPLVAEWMTDDSLANLFRVACPYLYDLDTVTYFALTRGQHLDKTIARIRDTTQVLVDVFHSDGQTFLHPIKALDRYSPTMFLPHVFQDEQCIPVFESGQAAELLSSLRLHPLQTSGGTSVAPWDRMFRRVLELRAAGQNLKDTSAPEVQALKEDLLRMTMGTRQEFLDLADRYIDLDDLLMVRDRLIGSGRIGGKAAGMILARKILETPHPDDEYSFKEILEPHDSFYIGSDVFFSYLVDNRLFRVRLQQGKDIHAITQEYASIQEQFLAGRFSNDIIDQFARMLEYFGQAPIIVRSSSLLEDDFGNAFAGKYDSIFCANQGHLPDRLEAFVTAVKKVYASALSPDALAYRRKHNLADTDEQMAILVQRVAGRSHGPYFLPFLAGVGFTRSPYVWNDRLDPEQGMLRLVAGLGTRAVDRVGGDYPRTVFLSHPTLRPEADPSKVMKYSQHLVDALDTSANEFVTFPIEELLSQGQPLPRAHLLFSSFSGGHISDPVSRIAVPEGTTPVATLNGLLKRTEFTSVMKAMLSKLERAYGRPVDTEFTLSVRDDNSIRVNLLQCRTLALPGSVQDIKLPENLDSERILFRSDRSASGGVCTDIRFIIYIDPRWYDVLPVERKRQLGRLVGALNNHPELSQSTVMMMGPGRWGSNNIDLGVNVTYSDISNASVLVEIARARGGHIPEVSYGTHFFQDLVEDGILYVPVYPDKPGSDFNEEFFSGSQNALSEYLPDWSSFCESLKLIDLSLGDRGLATLMIDAQKRESLCFFER